MSGQSKRKYLRPKKTTSHFGKLWTENQAIEYLTLILMLNHSRKICCHCRQFQDVLNCNYIACYELLRVVTYATFPYLSTYKAYGPISQHYILI